MEPQPEHVTLTDLIAVAKSVNILNLNVRNLNRALFGETSTGPEDQFGEVGKNIATAARELNELLNDLIAEFERRRNG